MEVLFVDTSAWLEVLDSAAPEHEPFRRALMSAPAIVTTNHVVDEVLTRCLYRRDLGLEVAIEAGEVLFALELVQVTADDERAAWDLFRTQPKPRPREGLSFTDCTSFVVMRRLALKRAIAKDSDFTEAGFELVPPRPATRHQR